MFFGIGLTVGLIVGWFLRGRSHDVKTKLDPRNWFKKDGE